MLDEVADDLRASHPGLDVHTRLAQGDAVVALRRASETARLTVVGSRGRAGSPASCWVRLHWPSPRTAPRRSPSSRSTGPDGHRRPGRRRRRRVADQRSGHRVRLREAAVRGARVDRRARWSDPRPTLSDVSAVDIARLDRERAGGVVGAVGGLAGQVSGRRGGVGRGPRPGDPGTAGRSVAARSCWWSAAGVAAGSPGCCSARPVIR